MVTEVRKRSGAHKTTQLRREKNPQFNIDKRWVSQWSLQNGCVSCEVFRAQGAGRQGAESEYSSFKAGTLKK